MNVVFNASFLGDLKKIKDKKLLKKIEKSITQVKGHQSHSQISNLKKIKGHSFAWRIKVDDYRIGVFIYASTVEFIAALPRKDIYKHFPK